jgi:hypothetical protein
MLGGEHHEGGAEEGVGPRGEHGEWTGGGGEVDPGAMAATDPVPLHRLDGIGPVEEVEVIDQAIGVGGDAHHPLAHVPLEHGIVAAVAPAVGSDLLIGDDGSETGAPVDRCFAHVGETMVVEDPTALSRIERVPGAAIGGRPFTGGELGNELVDRTGRAGALVVPSVEDLREDPLGPAVVVGIGRRDRAACVVTQTESTQLATHVRDVPVGGDRRVLTGLHRVLLGRQTEGIEAHRVKDVVAGHALEAREHIGADVAEWMPDV